MFIILSSIFLLIFIISDKSTTDSFDFKEYLTFNLTQLIILLVSNIINFAAFKFITNMSSFLFPVITTLTVIGLSLLANYISKPFKLAYPVFLTVDKMVYILSFNCILLTNLSESFINTVLYSLLNCLGFFVVGIVIRSLINCINPKNNIIGRQSVLLILTSIILMISVLI